MNIQARSKEFLTFTAFKQDQVFYVLVGENVIEARLKVSEYANYKDEPVLMRTIEVSDGAMTCFYDFSCIVDKHIKYITEEEEEIIRVKAIKSRETA